MAITNNDTSTSYLMTDFISLGKNNSLNLDMTNLIATCNGLTMPISNIFRVKYRDLIITNSFIVNFDDTTYQQYRFKPKSLSYDLYGTTELWHLLIWLNNLTSVAQFDLQSPVIFDPSQIAILNSIIEIEATNLTSNQTDPGDYTASEAIMES
jgi:hypothetical protein